MEKVKVAIIGLGGVAQLVHLPNLAKIKYAEIISVSDIKASRLNAVADKIKVKERYKDYKELLDKSDVDAVIIATPTSSHKQIAIDSLNAKKDVLVEKPISINYSEAKAMVDAAKKNKKKLMVGMNLRFRPDMMLLRSMIDSGEIGELFYSKALWIRRQSSTEKWFTKREEAGGGVILDLGVSLLDLSLWLLDNPKVKSVQTHNYFHSTKNLEDTSISFLRCNDSKIINIETSWSLPVAEDLFRLRAFGSKGSINSTPFHVYKKVNNQFIDLRPSIKETPSQLFKKSYLNELKSFLGAVRELNPVLSSGEAAAERIKIIEAMYSSAKKSKEININ